MQQLNEEDIEFEEASKNIKTLWLKKSLREQGINTKTIPLYKLDEIRRALDKSQNVQNKYNPKFKVLQDEMQSDATEARAEVDKLILQIKTDQQKGQVTKPQEKLEILPVQPEQEQDHEPEQKQNTEPEIIA